jgi:hypothetical protein
VEALVAVLNSPLELLEQFGAKARETVKVNHDVDIEADMLKRCFSNVLLGEG